MIVQSTLSRLNRAFFECQFKQNESKQKTFFVVSSTLCACFAILLMSILICRFVIRTVEYTVPLNNVTVPVRIAVISDLHGLEFGKANARLIEKIRAQEPDTIFLVGDMIESDADEADVRRLLVLIETLCETAPVYFAPGNHELEYMETDASLLDQVAAAGATVVNDSYVDVTIAGQTLRIGGTMGHGFYFGRSQEEFESSPEYQFLKDFEQTDAPKICLAHMPDTFIFNGAYDLWDVDLVISGHTHGGLVRLPFVGGLYAPMQGWFPTYDLGQFQLGTHMQLIITAGLTGHGWVPRVNNPPEIAVVELVPQTNS